MDDRVPLEQFAANVGGLTPFTRATYDPYAEAPAVGSGLLNPAALIARRGAPAPVAQTSQQPASPQEGTVWYDPTNKQLNINGYLVDEDDETALSTADQMLSSPFGGAAPTPGAVQLSAQSINQLGARIRNPSTWKLFKKNVGIGVDQLQRLAGQGVKLAGAEGLGQTIVDQQDRDLEKTAVYNRNFTDIDSPGGAVDWFVANLGQQVPNLAVSAVSGGVGGLIGGAARGALSTGVGALGLRMAGKNFLSGAALDAARKYAAGAALTTAERNALTGAATAAMNEALFPAAANVAKATLLNQARVGGATLGALAGNYAMGVSDVYGEMSDAGNPDRATALALGVPYALADTAPELLGAAALFRPSGAAKAVTAGAAAARRSPADFARNLARGVGKVARGAATGAAAEGSTEAFQEGLLLAVNPEQSFSNVGTPGTDEFNRIANSFAGGAALGGAFGAGGSAYRSSKLRKGAPTSLLSPVGGVDDAFVESLAADNPQYTTAAPQDVYLQLVARGLPSAEAARAAEQLYMRGVRQQYDEYSRTAANNPFGAPENAESRRAQNDYLNNLAREQERASSEGLAGAYGAPTTGAPMVNPQAVSPLDASNLLADYGETYTPLTDADRRVGVVQSAGRVIDEARGTNAAQAAQMNPWLNSMLRAQAERERQSTTAMQTDYGVPRTGAPAVNPQAVSPLEWGNPLDDYGEQYTPLTADDRAINPWQKANRILDQYRGDDGKKPAAKAPVVQAAPTVHVMNKKAADIAEALDNAIEAVAKSPDMVSGKQNLAKAKKLLSALTVEDDAAAVQYAEWLPETGSTDAQVMHIKNMAKATMPAPAPAPAPAKSAPSVEPAAQETADPVATLSKALSTMASSSGAARQAAEAVAKPLISQLGLDTPITINGRTTPVRNVMNEKGTSFSYKALAEFAKSGGVTEQQDVAPGKPVYEMVVPSNEALASDVYSYINDTKANTTVKRARVDAVYSAISTLPTDQRTDATQNIVEYIAPLVRQQKARLRHGSNLTITGSLLDKLGVLQDMEQALSTTDAREGTYASQYANQYRKSGGGAIAKDIVAYLRQDGNRANKINRLNEFRALYAADEDVVRKAAVRSTAYSELKQADDAGKFKATYKDSMTPVGELAQFLELLDNRHRLIDPDAAQAGTEAIAPMATPQAWDYIEDMTDVTLGEADASNTIKNFLYDIEKGRLSDNELTFITDTLGVGDLVVDDKLRPGKKMLARSALAKLFDKWDKDQIIAPGRNKRVDTGAPVKRIPVGTVRMQANAFKAKLAMPANVHVFSNVEDLRNSDPALYKRAAAARQDGTFDTTNAAGYSFGDTVILFADNLYTPEQVRNTLAHELIGHVGLRSILSPKELSAVLNDVYNSSNEAKAYVARTQDMYGISRAEATEEYLADKAADLDRSILKRVWAAIKRALNKLGCTFDDDMALAVLRQARKYARDGRLDAASRSMGVDVPRSNGRFMRADALGDDVHANGVDAAMSEDDPVRYEETMTMNQFRQQRGVIPWLRNIFADFRGNPARAKRLADVASKAVGMFRTLNDLAQDCVGVEQLYRILQRRGQTAARMLSQLEQMTPITHAPGTTNADKLAASKMLAYGSLHMSTDNLAARIAAMPQLIVQDDNGVRRMVPQDEQKKFVDMGILSADDFSKGITYKDSRGVMHTFSMPVKATDTAYKVYVENRRMINQAALFEAQGEITRALQSTVKFTGTFADIMKGFEDTGVNATVRSAFRKLATEYLRMREDAVRVRSGELRINQTKVVRAEDALQDFLNAVGKEKRAQDLVNNDNLKALGLTEEDCRAIGETMLRQAQINAVRSALHSHALSTMQSVNAEQKAKETIARGYVPFRRRGDKQVVLVAYDKQGNRVYLNDAFAGVVPRFHGDEETIQGIASQLDTLFPKDKYVTVVGSDGEITQVTFVPEVSDTETTGQIASHISVAEFVSMLETLNIDLDAAQTERMVRALAGAANSAVNTLHREGNPGFDMDMIRSSAEFAHTRAHSAAAKAYQQDVTDLFTDNANWYGDKSRLAELEAAVKTAPDADTRRAAQRAYDKYARMYMHMAAKSRNNTVVVGGKQRECLGQGNYYKEKAKELVRWSSTRNNVSSITGDILNSDFGSKVKAVTVMAQLGGSLASAAVNMLSIFTNSLPYFAYYNKSAAFGLGHGFGKSMASLTSALNDVKNFRMSDLTFLEQLQSSGDFVNYNLTKEEIDFLVEQTKQGTLQAAQYNHLMGEAQGKVQNNLVAAGIKAWMSMFSYTEQLNRRATALAAFRLERARGVPIDKAADIAVQAVDTTQGNYDSYNRPAMGRHNLGQYLYMYKQFVVTSLQLLKNMDYRGRLTYLSFILLLSGLKGIPFADDAMDMLDTLCQALGIKVGSVEEELIRTIDDIAPGMAPYFMRGVMDKTTGATVSTRVGMGDIVPLTGMLKAGADPWKETSQFLGPVLSGMIGTVGMAMSLGRMGLEAAGVREGNTTFNQILRNSPVAAFRILGDAAAYATDGSVTNATGAVISPNVSAMTIGQRLLGFYPADATFQNDVVRIAKQKDAYIKEVKAAFVGAYVRADIGKDEAAKRKIERSVREWNAAASAVAPDMKINEFRDSVNRAVRAARMPTGARHLKAVSKGLRQSEQQLLAIYGYAPGDL